MNKPFQILLTLSFLVISSLPSSAEVVDFTNDTWTNTGFPAATGWTQPADLNTSPYSGVTTLANGVTVAITATNVGTVTHDASDITDHLNDQTYSTGTGLNLWQDSGNAFNDDANVLEDYIRVDIALSEAAAVEFFIHDIDARTGDWDDGVYVESFAGPTFDPVGTGTQAIYASLGTNVETTVSNGGLTTLQANSLGDSPPGAITDGDGLTDHSAEINFAGSVQYFSLYYWNRDPDAGGTIFIDNQQIDIAALDVTAAVAVPEPGSMALLCLVGLGGFLKRRSKKH